MKKYNNEIGHYGEICAEKYLKEHGYSIVQHNFWCKYGEIDLIGINDNTLCFIEVKSRHSLLYGLPYEAVTCSKIRKIHKTAQYFIMKNKIFNINCRFDVIEIYFNYNDNLENVNLLKDAF